MNFKLLIITSALLFSCNNKQAKKHSDDSLPTTKSKTKDVVTPKKSEDQKINIPSDTTSSDYLIYLLRNELAINNYWIKKLNALDIFALQLDTIEHLSIMRDWRINDSISVIILSRSTGTDYDKFLLTIKNKKDIISKVHISDRADSDVSLEHPYYYTEYKMTGDKKVKTFNHKVIGIEGGEEKDRLISVENWTIQNNGTILKK
ncbi:MAG: hypothetical protein ABJB86_18680 [Bacteroidota bacterium]